MRRTLLAAIVALLVAGSSALLWRVAAPSTARHPLSDLAQAVGGSLPFEARLTGGFAPSDGSSVRRADSSAAAPLSPDARIAIALIEKRAAAEDTQEAQAALGVAYLVSGDTDRAISMLDDATAMGDAAGPWSDLSAAYLVKAERVPTRRVEYYARALEAASTSIRLAPSNEARFNRALALQSLAPYLGIPDPWDDVAAAEAEPSWRAAVDRHRSATRLRPRASEQWQTRQRELEEALDRLDRTAIEAMVRLHPEATLEFFEQYLLVQWARSVVTPDPTARGRVFAQARLVANALNGATADRLPRDAAESLSSAAATLAHAHLAYASGLLQYDSNDYAAARRSFESALAGFSASGSSYRWWAVAQLATLAFQERDLAGADAQLARVEQAARQSGFVTLLGRTLWLRGLVYSKQWRLPEALEAFRASAAQFEAAGEHEYAVSLYHHLADALRTLGEQQESWAYIGQTLAGLSRVRKPVRRYLFLFNAALFAASQDLPEAALQFQDAAVRTAAEAPTEVLLEGHARRAAIHVRRRDRASALQDLATVRDGLLAMGEGPLKRGLQAEADFIAAQIEGPDDWSAVSLSRTLAFFGRAEPARVPQVMLVLARGHARDGAVEEADAALSKGIGQLEHLQSRLDDDALRISYFDESWELFPEMVRFQLVERTNPARAFEYAERGRARTLLAATEGAGVSQTRRLDEIQPLLPPSVTLVYYVTLADRLLIWTITAKAATLIERQENAHELERLVARHRDAIAARRVPQHSNDRLYEALVAPVAGALTGESTVVFAPDGPLQHLPFATLKNPATGRYLVQDHALAVTPSASFFVAGLARLRLREMGPITSALLVGNPESPSQVSLPGAAAEVSAVAGHYQQHVVLTGSAATKDRFVAAAPSYDVVHFGGHAVANTEFPLLSRLVFAGVGESGTESLFAHEIARMRFPRTRIVVLAACSTAAGAVSRGEGVVSVSSPFLGSGVSMVVASHWDVGDRSTAQLFAVFHRELAVTQDPVAALRAAQLALLRGGDPVAAEPVSWGAFVALGTTAR